MLSRNRTVTVVAIGNAGEIWTRIELGAQFYLTRAHEFAALLCFSQQALRFGEVGVDIEQHRDAVIDVTGGGPVGCAFVLGPTVPDVAEGREPSAQFRNQFGGGGSHQLSPNSRRRAALKRVSKSESRWMSSATRS